MILSVLVCADYVNGQSTFNETKNIDNPGMDEIGYIFHYLSSYYSKWEAEENQLIDEYIGVKHRYGKQAEWKGADCWSTIGLASPKDSLMFGPHYFQDKKYNRSFLSNWIDPFNLRYIPRFRMALVYNPKLVSPDENVCVIKVVYRYTKQHLKDEGIYQEEIADTVLRADTLTVSRFNTDSTFRNIYFKERFDVYYTYPPKFRDCFNDSTKQTDTMIITDQLAGNGIQFCIDWLRNDALCTLYIDYAEVYDENGWSTYLNDPYSGAEMMGKYITDYLDWKYIPYLSSQIKFTNIDQYIPLTTIDSILIKCGAPSLFKENILKLETSENKNIKNYYWFEKKENIMIEKSSSLPDL